jgi:hypothetical protein
MAYPISVRQRIAEILGFSKSGVRRIHEHFNERGTLVQAERARHALTAHAATRGQAPRVRRTALHQQVAQVAWPCAQHKSKHASEQDRPDVANARAAWPEQLREVKPESLVILNESGAQTNMTHTDGGAAPWRRCHTGTERQRR